MTWLTWWLYFRREALHLSLRGLQQALLQFQWPVQTHAHALCGQALLLQDGGLLKTLHGPQLPEEAYQGSRHFVAQEQGGPGGVGSLMKPGQIAGAGKESELTYVSGAHIIIPGAAAALLGGHGLQGLRGSLPLSPLSPRPLDLSTLGCPSSCPAGLGGTSILSFSGSPLGLAKSPLLSHTFSSSTLGLPMVPILGSERRDHGMGKARGEEGEDEIHGGVLNLSTGASHDPLSWVVIPSGSVVLKPAVVNWVPHSRGTAGEGWGWNRGQRSEASLWGVSQSKCVSAWRWYHLQLLALLQF